MLPTCIFIVFSTILLLAALGVVFARQAVHAALNLVLAFFTAACLWVTLDAEFLGLVLILVYVGAVMVLFLFVLMMLDLTQEAAQTVNAPDYRVRTAIIILCFVVEMALLYTNMQAIPVNAAAYETTLSSGWSVQQLALRLFNDYPYTFEVAGAILLFAMVAVIGLIKHTDKQDSSNLYKRQDISEQVRVKKADRLVLVKSS